MPYATAQKAVYPLDCLNCGATLLTSSAAVSTPQATITAADVFALLDAFFMGQGIATDGEVSLAFERNLGGEAEAKGLTVWPAQDGSLFHILDYNKSLSVFLRHYKVKL